MQIHYIKTDILPLSVLQNFLVSFHQIRLSQQSKQKIIACQNYLAKKINAGDQLFYGINTGFGSLCNIRISKDQLQELQTNLVKSHACGMGEVVPIPIVRLMLFLKIQNLSYGHSGVRLETVQRLIDFYNHDILPVIYQQGSLGASGDLAPLAHLSLPLLGEGDVWHQGKKTATSALYKKLGWQPLVLAPKEGLALLNGTQFSTAYGVWCLLQSRRLVNIANLCAAVSIDAFECGLSPFDAQIHRIRLHKGQRTVAATIRKILAGSQIAAQNKEHVQDPYAFRCVPQVHGASLDALEYIEAVFEREVNAVTDNPNIFPDTDSILSGGNFHAQPLALPLDYLAIALAELGNISERRTYQLISGNRGLTAFLTPQAGLNSGLMIPQYTAASIVSQNKQLCTPASVDSIVSSNGQEDHVSMAANAATKAYRVVQNVERILAIEWMTAMQALEFRRPLKSSSRIEELYQKYRAVVPKLEHDRIMHTDMKKTIVFLREI